MSDGTRAEIAMALEYAGYAKDLDTVKRLTQGGMTDMVRSADALKSVFASLGAALSVGAFASMIRGTIDSVAALGELSTKAGVSVESLSALAAVGKQSGTGAETIASSMNKLSKSMASASEDGKGAGQALRALGINFDDFAKLDPDQQMLAVAKAMNGFADGGGKSAAAMMLFGKQGAEMLPMMRDLADTGELQAKVTEAQKEQAIAFERSMIKLKASGEGWKKELAMGMLPALSEFAQATLGVLNGTGGLRDEIKRLSADGTLAEWTRGAITAFTYLLDVAQGLLSVFPMLGKVIAGVFAGASTMFSSVLEAMDKLKAGDLSGAWQSMKNGLAGVGAVAEQVGVDIAGIWNQKLLGQAIRDRMGDIRNLGETAEKAKPKVDLRDQLNGSADAMNKLVDAGVKLAQSLLGESGGLSSNFYDQWNKLAAAFGAGAISADVLERAQAKLLSDQPAMKAAMKEVEEAAKAVAAARQKESDGIDAYLAREKERAQQTAHSGIVAVQAAQDEFDNYGKLKSEIAETTLLRLQDWQTRTRAGTAAYDDIQAQIDAQLKLIGILKQGEVRDADIAAAKEAQAAWAQVSNGFVDAMMGGTRQLASYIKTTLENLVIRVPLQALMAGIGGGASGSTLSAGGTSLAGNLAGATGALGAFGSFGATGFMSTMTGTGLGTSLGASGALMSGGNIAGGLGMGVGAIAPYVIAAAALATMLDKKATPHVGGYSLAGADGGLTDITAQQGGIANATSQAATDALATAVASALNSTASTFGKEAGYSVRSVFESDSNDPSWGLFHLLQGGKQTTGSFDALGTLNKDPSAGFQQYAGMAAEGVRSALEALDIPKWAAGLLDKLGSAPAMDKLISEVSTINSVQAAIVSLQDSIRPLGGVFTQIAGLSSDATYNLAKAAGGLDALNTSLSGYYSNFYTQSEQAAAQWAAINSTLAAVGLSTPKTRDEFRQLVSAQDLTTASGQSAFGALMKVQGAFAGLTPAITDAATAITDATTTIIDAAATSTATASGIGGRSTTDSSYAKWQSTYNSITPEQLASYTAAYVEQAHNLKGYQDPNGGADLWAKDGPTIQMWAGTTMQGMLQQSLTDALIAQGPVVAGTAWGGPAMGNISSDTSDSRHLDLLAQQNTALQSLIQALDGVETSLNSYMDTLSQSDMSILSPEQKYLESKAAFDTISKQAGAGDQAAAEKLQSVVETMLNNSRGYNGSGGGYVADYNAAKDAMTSVAAKMDSLVKLASQQLGVTSTGISAQVTAADKANAINAQIAKLQQQQVQANVE